MRSLGFLSLSLLLTGCGFKFALGDNPYGAPLAPVVVVDQGGQGVGESLKRHLPAALARSGLTKGPEKARRLTVQITPWDRTTLYNTVNRRVVFGSSLASGSRRASQAPSAPCSADRDRHPCP